ncbi:MAG: hypothetical protein WDO14_19785 [Bacteroidota bacterium]
MQKSIFVFCLVILATFGPWTPEALAQATNASTNEDYYHWLDRYEIKSGRVVTELFTTIKPYKRNTIVAYVDSLEAKDHVFTSSADKFNYEYFRNDNWEWSRAVTSDSRKPIWNTFYKKKSDLYNVDVPDFDLHVSPVLYAGLGYDMESGGNIGKNQKTFINTRGIEIRSMIDKKIGIYAYFTDNQAILPGYVERTLSQSLVVPHEGFWKPFKTNGVDYFQARGYIDVNISKHVYVQLGHDRMFIGNGIRSLIWSDYAPPQLYLRANVKVWKINYMFQLNRMTADVNGSAVGGLSNGKYPEKYVAFHHASINIGKKFNLGLFESIVFSPKDSVNGQKAAFEWSYVNPVIFYRAIEQQYGSADNAIIGGDFKWNAFKGVSIYGQFVLDEFVLGHIKAHDGWWANKFALQGGIKYIDAFGVSNLDLQLETNIVRPYTYSHNARYANYTNYRQPIAHPAGANFKEVICVVKYQPLGRLNLTGKLILIKGGSDLGTLSNYGGDPLKNNNTHVQDLGNKIGQGTPYTRLFASFTASYMVKHNIFVDLQLVKRTENFTYDPGVIPGNVAPPVSTTAFVSSLAVRWNIAPRNYDF